MQEDKLSALSTTLKQALVREPFPLRGWDLDLTAANDLTKLWPLYKHVPETSATEGMLQAPDIEEHLLTSEITATAVFRFTKYQIVIGGREYRFSDEVVDKQILHFLDRTEKMGITFDPKVIQPYSQKTLIPDRNAFAAAVEKWVVKKNRTPIPFEQAYAQWMIVQLAGVKQNSLSAMQTMLGKLVNTVRDAEPDYFGIIEGLMSGLYNPNDAIVAAKGAIMVAVSPEYVQQQAPAWIPNIQ